MAKDAKKAVERERVNEDLWIERNLNFLCKNILPPTVKNYTVSL